MLNASQFARYAVAGGAGAVVHWGALWGLVQLSVDPRVATGIGYSFAVVTNYTIQYNYTFRSRLNHRKAFSRFFLVTSVGLALNIAAMHVLTIWLGVWYFAAQILVTGTLYLINYAVNKRFTFGLITKG
jgi:putative flippase GtrA